MALVFSPPDRGHWARKLYRELSADEPVLFLANGADSLAQGAVPGVTTLIAPRFPDLTDEALRRARAVITGNPAMAARAREFATPVLEVTAATSLTSIRSWLAECPARMPVHAAHTQTSLALCSVADRRYAPFVLGLLENLQRLGYPLDHYHLLALDEEVERVVSARFAVRILRLDDIWAEWELATVRPRGPGALAFSSKPRLLRRVLADEGRPVLYTDLDIFYFQSPEPLVDALGDGNFLLFPQWNDQLWHSKFYGVFNAGMVVVRAGAERFLEWWSDRCIRDYNGDFLKGYYADQGFLDLVPIYFPEARIYRDGDHNLAYWNTGSLVDNFEAGSRQLPALKSGRAIKSFHAAVPDSLGLYEWKFGWDQLAAFFGGHATTLLQETVLQQQAEHWLAVSRLRRLESLLHVSLQIWRPKVADWLLYSPLRHVIHVASRTHYHLSSALRRLRRGRDAGALPNRSHFSLVAPPPLPDGPRQLW